MNAVGGGGTDKGTDAFRTIGELSRDLGVPQHILRYWETRFPQLKPLQRAGNRRYYRPEDVALAQRIHHLLNNEGYTVRGVQQVLKGKGGAAAEVAAPAPKPVEQVKPAPAPPPPPAPAPGASLAELRALRAKLVAALEG